jgi:hypothetical protein
MQPLRHFVLTLMCGVCLCAHLRADDKPSSEDGKSQLSESEEAFVKLLSNAVLAGSFTIDGKETAPKAEKYAINGVTKVDGQHWVVAARISYGTHDVTVPVPVEVLWAGDTPMIQVTNLGIPGLGEEFSARVLFYQNRYAGTWSHGKVGGTMFGKIEKQDQPAEGEPQKKSP